MSDKVIMGGAIGSTILVLSLMFAAFAGWIMNIMAIVSMGEFTWTGEVVIRCIGVFVFPIGCIAGWC